MKSGFTLADNSDDFFFTFVAPLAAIGLVRGDMKNAWEISPRAGLDCY